MNNLETKRPLRNEYLFSYSDNFLNKEIKSKNKSKEVYTHFKKITGGINDLIEIINKGYAISPSIFKENYRNKDNVISSDFWIGDIDKDLTIEDFFKIDFFKKYSFIYTSPSHTESHHRFRIIIPLPSSIDLVTYAILSNYIDDLCYQKLDKAPKHAAAIFYGNTNAQFFNVENVHGLPQNFIEEILRKPLESEQKSIELKTLKTKNSQEKFTRKINQISESKKKAIDLIQLLPQRQKGSGQYQKLITAIWGACSLWTIESNIDFFSSEGQEAIEELISLLENSPCQSDLSQKWDLEKLINNFDPTKGITSASFFGYFKENNIPIPDTEIKTKKPKKIRVAYELIDQIFKDRLKLNLLSQNLELDGEIADLENFYISLAVDYGIEISDKLAWDIAKEIGKKYQYHPVQNYFRSLVDQPELTLNLKQLATVLFGTEESIYNEMFFRFLIASVARTFEPGCKVDTVLVLQGQTGYRKSTFFKVLYGDNWCSDSLQGLDKDNLLILHQFWCCELAELETITSKKEAGELKAFISRSVDNFRKPYGKVSTQNKRQGVLVGSVNESEFLVDTTGNRRFWIIPIKQRIDTDLIEKWRDRIWYLAYQEYLRGENWILSESLENENLEINQQYLFSDPWCTNDFVTWIERLEDYKRTANYIFTFYFKFDQKDITIQNSKRLGKILTSLGYANNGRIRIEGKCVRCWVKK